MWNVKFEFDTPSHPEIACQFHVHQHSKCYQNSKSRRSQLIKIDIDLSIDKSIKIGRSVSTDINCVDQSVEIDDTLISFINLS